MGKIYDGSAPLSKVYDVSINAPLDNRIAVRYVADLTTGENGGIAAQVYKGMIVYVQEDNSLYIYTGSSNSTWKTSKGKLVNGGDINNWKKVDSFLDPSVNLQYYAEKIGAKIFEREDELIGEIDSPYRGMFAVVTGDSDESTVEETGLYILLDDDNTNIANWMKIDSGNGDYVTRDELDEYLKKNELPDFLTDSDLDSYVKVEDLDGYLKPEDIADLAKKSDLDGYVKREDALEYLTASDLGDYATKDYVDDKINKLIGGAPETLDTLKEIAEALEDNATMSQVAEAISTKANKSDVYTKDEVDAKIDALPKEGSFPELDGSEAGFTDGYAKVSDVIDYVADSISQATPDLTPYATKEEIPTKVSELDNDEGYLTEHQDLSNYATKDYVDVVMGSLDIPEHSEVLTTNGTQPTSGSGLSVSNSQDNAFIEEIYVDDYLHAGIYYTSKGINSSKDNGGSELEGIDYITLSNAGDSWIRFNNRSTITLYIHDDSLGFNAENIVGIIDSNGTETRNPYVGYPYTESPISLPLGGNTYIKFNKDIYFTGMIEVRGEDPTEYIFGQTGSNYEDLDIYSVNVLPTVKAYVDGVSTRVLTEGDKIELTNMIDNKSLIQPISTQEILNLFP